MNNMMQNKGFTLIELLVVIAIIALLSSVVLTTLTEARSKARNAKRQAEINNIIKAFAIGLNDKGYLPQPSATGTFFCISDTCQGPTGSPIPSDPTVSAYLSEYITQINKDQKIGKTGMLRGYRYYETSVALTSSYNGEILQPGKHIAWFEDLPVNKNSCNGNFILTASNDEIACRYRLDQ